MPQTPPPPPYNQITGISRADMKYNEQESLTDYNGNARPGELVVDLTSVPPALYVGNNLGQLNAVGGSGGSTTWATLGDKNNASGPTVIALGREAGNTSAQGANAIAIGTNAGSSSQGATAVAIGQTAGQTTQGVDAIAIGRNAGSLNQALRAVAVGAGAGSSNQSFNSIAIGTNAGASNCRGIAIGFSTAGSNQGQNAIAIGAAAGGTNQSIGAVAIGFNAGSVNQGANAVALGYNAGQNTQDAGSIVINATGVTLPSAGANTLTIRPVRQVTSTNVWSNPANTLPTGFFFTAYNPTTGELIYWS